VGARTPGEAEPARLRNGSDLRKQGRARRRGARAEATQQELWRGTELQESSSRDSRFAARHDEEDPVVVSNDEGGAPEANKALLDGHYKTLQGTGTS